MHREHMILPSASGEPFSGDKYYHRAKKCQCNASTKSKHNNSIVLNSMGLTSTPVPAQQPRRDGAIH